MPYDEPRFIGRRTIDVNFPAANIAFTASGAVATSTAGAAGTVNIPLVEAVKVLGAAFSPSVTPGTITTPGFVLTLVNGTTTSTALSFSGTNTALGQQLIAVQNSPTSTAANLTCDGTHGLVVWAFGTGTASATATSMTGTLSILVESQFV